MVVMSEAPVDVSDGFDPPSAVRERLEAFGIEVLAEAMNRPVQVRNGGLYLRGLIEQGARKSLEPIVERLGEDADYQSAPSGYFSRMVTARRNRIARRSPNQLSGSGEVSLIMNRSNRPGANVPNRAFCRLIDLSPNWSFLRHFLFCAILSSFECIFFRVHPRHSTSPIRERWHP